MTTTQTLAPVVDDPADIMRLHTSKAIRTNKYNPTLIVNHRSFGHADEDRVVLGLVDAIEVTLTSDGRYYNQGEWHTGPEAESVYVERWDATGRIFHGFIDSVSRRLVQAG